MMFLMRSFHAFQRSAFVFKICLSGFLPNHRNPAKITEHRVHAIASLSRSAWEIQGLSGSQQRLEEESWILQIFHIICLLNQHAWESEWQHYKLRQQGEEWMWPRLISYSESHLFILKSTPLCEVWGCGGGRSFAPVPWPPPEWPLHLKTVPET